MGIFLLVKMERTCDLVSRGSRIKTAEVTAVFTARGVVLFASKESDSDRSELTKQVTDAQLAKAFIKSLQRMRLMRRKFFLRCT